MSGIQLPKQFSLPDNNEQEKIWKRWKQRFEDYMLASGAHVQPERVKIALFRQCLDDTCLDILEAFEYTAGENKNDYTTVLTKFDKYFTDNKSVTVERALFNSRIQKEGEKLDVFITDVKKLANQCGFGTMKDELIADRIMVGVRERELQRKLSRITPLTLTKAESICKEFIETERRLNRINPERENPNTDVHAVQRSRRDQSRRGGKFQNYRSQSRGRAFRQSRDRGRSGQRNYNNNKNGESQKHSTQTGECGNCGYQHAPKRCPAYGKTCLYCNRQNHFIRKCRIKLRDEGTNSSVKSGHNKGRINQVENVNNSDEETIVTADSISIHNDTVNTRDLSVSPLFIGSVECQGTIGNTAPRKNTWYEKMFIYNADGYMWQKIDTGADASILNYHDFQASKGKLAD